MDFPLRGVGAGEQHSKSPPPTATSRVSCTFIQIIWRTKSHTNKSRLHCYSFPGPFPIPPTPFFLNPHQSPAWHQSKHWDDLPQKKDKELRKQPNSVLMRPKGVSLLLDTYWRGWSSPYRSVLVKMPTTVWNISHSELKFKTELYFQILCINQKYSFSTADVSFDVIQQHFSIKCMNQQTAVTPQSFSQMDT